LAEQPLPSGVTLHVADEGEEPEAFNAALDLFVAGL
jgi:hypothetical protein